MRRLIRIKKRGPEVTASTSALEQLFTEAPGEFPRQVNAIRRGTLVATTVTYCRVEHNKFRNIPQVILKGSDVGAGWGWFTVYDPNGKLDHNKGQYSGPYLMDGPFIQEMIERFYLKPVNEAGLAGF